jgi:hypothetical protein
MHTAAAVLQLSTAVMYKWYSVHAYAEHVDSLHREPATSTQHLCRHACTAHTQQATTGHHGGGRSTAQGNNSQLLFN